MAELRVGVVGVGNMGGGIARALLARPACPTTVHDVRPDAVVALVAEGAVAAGSAAGWRPTCDVVCVVVFDAAQVDDVLFGPDGIVEGAAPGTVVCICSTVDVAVVHDAHERAAVAGVRVIDAGVAGGPARGRRRSRHLRRW